MRLVRIQPTCAEHDFECPPQPDDRVKRWLPPHPGTSPYCACWSPMRALFAANTTSAPSISSVPPARHKPCTAAITGSGLSSSASSALWPRSTKAWTTRRIAFDAGRPHRDRHLCRNSCPGREPEWPSPRGSLSKSRRARSIWSHARLDRQLNFSGRASSTIPTPRLDGCHDRFAHVTAPPFRPCLLWPQAFASFEYCTAIRPTFSRAMTSFWICAVPSPISSPMTSRMRC